ncbi:MAG: Mur ligase family protein [Coriobacteriia bacterium]|nr:Mur ligase family protein [Coriobacteriia bacterium]
MISDKQKREAGKALGINLSLEEVRLLAEEFGNPQNTFASVRVTGTNGKTSTARLIGALLLSAGQKSGLFVSPGMKNPIADITVGGEDIREDRLERYLLMVQEKAKSLRLRLTDFEIMVLACLLVFRDERVDFAVIESGLGGTWDATGVVTASVAVITGVALDHTEVLGETAEEIARNKSHVICPGSSVVLGEGVRAVEDIFLKRAKKFGVHPLSITEDSYRVYDSASFGSHFDIITPHAIYENLWLAGPPYQLNNATVAVTATEALLGRTLDPQRVRDALAHMTFPGRFEILATYPDGTASVIFDGAHNPEAAHHLARAVEHAIAQGALREKPLCALGVLTDKDLDGIISALAPVVHAFVPLAVEQHTGRARAATELHDAFVAHNVPISDEPATSLITPRPPYPLLITGSLTLYRHATDCLDQH